VPASLSPGGRTWARGREGPIRIHVRLIINIATPAFRAWSGQCINHLVAGQGHDPLRRVRCASNEKSALPLPAPVEITPRFPRGKAEPFAGACHGKFVSTDTTIDGAIMSTRRTRLGVIREISDANGAFPVEDSTPGGARGRIVYSTSKLLTLSGETIAPAPLHKRTSLSMTFIEKSPPPLEGVSLED